jgi:hypothetical protein
MAQPKKRQPEEAAPPADHVCPVGFCPVGMFLSLSERARPEAVEHLLAAGREFMLALAAVINARVDDLDRSPSIEKIELE